MIGKFHETSKQKQHHWGQIAFPGSLRCANLRKNLRIVLIRNINKENVLVNGMVCTRSDIGYRNSTVIVPATCTHMSKWMLLLRDSVQTACLPTGVLRVQDLMNMGNLYLEIWRPFITNVLDAPKGHQKSMVFYPIHIGYAGTVYKLQGATLPHVTIWLDRPHIRAAAYASPKMEQGKHPLYLLCLEQGCLVSFFACHLENYWKLKCGLKGTISTGK